jgi:hypothetical protein
VFVRRSGEFRLAGFGRTPREAVGIGRRIARRTLAATFKVPSARITKVPRFRTKKEKKEGIVFIQKRRFRLAAPTEVKEIQFFKRVKGGRKK